jgi:hypothetical protein
MSEKIQSQTDIRQLKYENANIKNKNHPPMYLPTQHVKH